MTSRETALLSGSTLTNHSPLNRSDVYRLAIQRFLGRLFVLPLGLAIIFLVERKFKLRIKNHAEIRKQFKEIARRGKPLIVCANHLTMVDSIILLWGLASIPTFFLNYRLFCWNIPAIENFSKKLSWRVVTFLNKCIPIDRGGSPEHIEGVLEKLRYLLRKGDLCMIFPEGTRSRSGKINPEAVGYGVGKIIQGVPDCEVLCIYLRGAGQETYSTYPKKRETYHLEMEVIRPHSSAKGLRAIRDYSVQTISKLKAMEDRYFSKLGEKCVSDQLETT